MGYYGIEKLRRYLVQGAVVVSVLYQCHGRFGAISKENLNPSQPNPGRREKINLSLYFHTSFQCLKVFMKAFKAPIKPCGTTKKCENKNLS